MQTKSKAQYTKKTKRKIKARKAICQNLPKAALVNEYLTRLMSQWRLALFKAGGAKWCTDNQLMVNTNRDHL